MKTKLLVACSLLVVPAFAGTTAKEVIQPPPQAPPSLWSWFVGGSAGYLVDSEEWMYTAHIGVDTPWQMAGWNVALFAELGYTEFDETGTRSVTTPGSGYSYASAFVTAPTVTNYNYDTDLEVMPLTIDVKFERPISGNLNAYFGAGVGVAFLDYEMTSAYGPLNQSDDDSVFYGQIFAGLVYNVTPSFEIFGGARWVYFDDANMFGSDVDLDDDVMFELGARFNF